MKNFIIDDFDMPLCCPECDCESLSVDDDGFGTCQNPDCEFAGYVKKCENEDCSNALYDDDTAEFCSDCLDSFYDY